MRQESVVTRSSQHVSSFPHTKAQMVKAIIFCSVFLNFVFLVCSVSLCEIIFDTWILKSVFICVDLRPIIFPSRSSRLRGESLYNPNLNPACFIVTHKRSASYYLFTRIYFRNYNFLLRNAFNTLHLHKQ